MRNALIALALLATPVQATPVKFLCTGNQVQTPPDRLGYMVYNLIIDTQAKSMVLANSDDVVVIPIVETSFVGLTRFIEASLCTSKVCLAIVFNDATGSVEMGLRSTTHAVKFDGNCEAEEVLLKR